MFVSIHCPNCSTALEVDEREVGMLGECPECSTSFVVRSPAAELHAAQKSKKKDTERTRTVVEIDDFEGEIPIAPEMREAVLGADAAAQDNGDDLDFDLDSDFDFDEGFDFDEDFEIDESIEVDRNLARIFDNELGFAETAAATAAGVRVAHPVSTQELEAAGVPTRARAAGEGMAIAQPVYTDDTEADDDDQLATAELEHPPITQPDRQEALPIAAPVKAKGAKGGNALLEVGDQIAGFEIGPLLGSGSMGQVYLATQVSMDREVALKILPQNIMNRDDDAVRNFLNEVRVLAKLDHPNIVTAFEAGEFEDIHYLAMSCVNGESLEQRQRREPVLPEREALEYCVKIARALEHAWTRFSLCHRDIKPANIMIDTMGEVKLMDMGIAKISTDEDGATSVVMGTPYYMSPEQATGRAGLDWRSDQYSLGATIYHLLTGRPPFTGGSSMEIMTQHAFDPLTAPRNINPAISEHTDRLIRRMMMKSPEKRFKDWADVILAMETIIEELREEKRHTPKGKDTDKKKKVSSAKQRRTRAAMASPRRAPRRRYVTARRRGASVGAYVAGFIIALMTLYLILAFLNRAGGFGKYRLPQAIFPPFLRAIEEPVE